MRHAERQAIWDANGAAIYEANKSFKEKHGHKMSAKERKKAIAAATVNGVFNAGAYSAGLEGAASARIARKQALKKKALKAKEKLLGLRDLPKKKSTYVVPDMSWKRADMVATAVAVEEIKKKRYQNALRAYHEGRKVGEERVLDDHQLTSNLFTNILDEGGNFSIGYATEFHLWDMEFSSIPDGPMQGKISLPGSLSDEARDVYKLSGTGAHNISTIEDAIDDVLLEDAIKIIDDGADSFLGKYGGPLLTTGISLYTNAVESFNDDSFDSGDQWQHFAIGTAVDLSLDWGIGIGAAAFASWAVPAFVGLLGTAGLVVTAPAWAPFAAAAFIAAGAGFAFDQSGWTDAIKNNINGFVDDIQGE